jgi:hypothetical protein
MSVPSRSSFELISRFWNDELLFIAPVYEGTTLFQVGSVTIDGVDLLVQLLSPLGLVQAPVRSHHATQACDLTPFGGYAHTDISFDAE